jgi:hypothetical protein
MFKLIISVIYLLLNRLSLGLVTKPSEIAPYSFILGFSSDGYIPSFGLRPFIHSSLCLNTFTLDPLGLKPFMVCLLSNGQIP